MKYLSKPTFVRIVPEISGIAFTLGSEFALVLAPRALSESAYVAELFRLPELRDQHGTAPFGINDHLDVVGWESEPEDHGEDPAAAPGFVRRSDRRIEGFAPPNAERVARSAINDLGVIVGYSFDPLELPVGLFLHPAVVLSEGQVELRMSYSEGRLDFVFRDPSVPTNHPPGSALLQVGAGAEQGIPDTLTSLFLGEPGHSTWILPDQATSELLSLDLPKGVLAEDSVRIQLVSLLGPGNVAVFTRDAEGRPVVEINSRDGYDSDAIQVRAGRIERRRWAFSAPGRYRVGLKVVGSLNGEITERTSAEIFVHFEVPPARLIAPFQPYRTRVYRVVSLGNLGRDLPINHHYAQDLSDSGFLTPVRALPGEPFKSLGLPPGFSNTAALGAARDAKSELMVVSP